MSFIFGTRGEESLIYGSLGSFLGVIVFAKAHYHVLLRNRDNMSEWIKKDSLCTHPEFLTIHEVLEECSLNQVIYLIDDSGVDYNENSDFKLYCLDRYLVETQFKGKLLGGQSVRQVAVELFLTNSLQSRKLFSNLADFCS